MAEPREIDRRFDVPPQLRWTLQRRDQVTTDPLVQQAESVDDSFDASVELISDDYDSEFDEDPVDDQLSFPSYINIISQTVNTMPDGTQLVDVVIDIEDIPGADKYEVKIVKA